MGGLTNIGASSVTCMDSKIYFYNMDCHVWVAHSVLDPVLSGKNSLLLNFGIMSWFLFKVYLSSYSFSQMYLFFCDLIS